MQYYYTIHALRPIDTDTDIAVQTSFIHKRGDITSTGAMRIAKRKELLTLGDRLDRIECICYDA